MEIAIIIFILAVCSLIGLGIFELVDRFTELFDDVDTLKNKVRKLENDIMDLQIKTRK